jgi:hypothetical protein
MFGRKKIYHYVLTIEAPNPNGYGMVRGTYHNLLEWNGTRVDALQNRFRYACQELGVDADAGNVTTVFWSFELNKL